MSNGPANNPEPSSSSSPAAGVFRGSGTTDSPSSSNQSQTLPSDQSAGSPLPTENSNAHSKNERDALIQQLDSVVEQFRIQHSTKTQAISSILRILESNPNVSNSGDQKEAAFNSCLAEILSIEGISSRSSIRPSSSTLRIDKGKKRVSSDDSEVNDFNIEEDDGEKPSKRLKLRESEIPWFQKSDSSILSAVNPSCDETCRLLRAYQKDVTKAKFFVKIAPGAPTGIPSSQWERIFKGETVDLNQIFASLHNVIVDEERKGRMGDAEISFGAPEAKKHVRTSAEWVSAWRRAAKAISFAFPHRMTELFDYGDYIEGKFAAKLPSSHHKILLYDIAVRNEVGAGQHTLLTETHRFSRLYSAIVMPDGVESHTSSSANRKTSSGSSSAKPEICNKYNNGTCKATDADCKYHHICKECRKSGHSKTDCEGKGK